MDYNTLLNKLPKDTELHYLSDCTQFFIDNKIKSKKYSDYNYILFEYTTDSFHNTINSLDSNNIDYTIKTDYLDLYYILIK